MDLVKVANHWTLEATGVTLRFDRPELIAELAENPVHTEEGQEYDRMAEILRRRRGLTLNDPTSRQIVMAHEPVPGTSDHWCFSSIQLLLDRTRPTMVVHQRSSDTARLSSDLGFLARRAQEWNIQVIVLVIGSLHTILT